jgi:hypothetical protein
MRRTHFETVFAGMTFTGSAYGPDHAFRFFEESRSTYPDLAAHSRFVKWSSPDRYVRVPVVTVNASTEDPSLILVAYPSVVRGYPEGGIHIDFDLLRRDVPIATHHTGFTKEMRRELTSTGPIRHISELNRLAVHGGLGGLDERGHLRAHHSTGGVTDDPLSDYWNDWALKEARNR